MSHLQPLPQFAGCKEKKGTFVFQTIRKSLITAFLLVCASGLASASTLLDGWAFNLDGIFTSFSQFDVATGANMPTLAPGSTFDAGAIDLAGGGGQIAGGTGLGTIGINVAGAGSHTVTLLLDLHHDAGDFWYSNEFGGSIGLLPTGLTWQIDDIYNSALYSIVASGGPLSNTSAFPDANNTGDVAVALSYTFTAPTSAGGQVNFYVADVFDTLPTSGFYVTQNNPNASGTLLFSAGVTTGVETQTPEPSAWALFASGGLLLTVGRFLRRPTGSRA